MWKHVTTETVAKLFGNMWMTVLICLWYQTWCVIRVITCNIKHLKMWCQISKDLLTGKHKMAQRCVWGRLVETFCVDLPVHFIYGINETCWW